MTLLIITICALILIAYMFDISSKHTRVPTVIFLMLLGWVVKQLANTFELNIINLAPLLPAFGTIGLILIVLEGGLELEINKEKIGLVKKAFWAALLQLVALCLIIGCSFYFLQDAGIMDSFINAVPLCVVSSTIAIPSVQHLLKKQREMTIYESSMSDIIGVVLFNFLVANEVIAVSSFLNFGIQLIVMLLVSLASSIGLALLIKKIDHQVKLVPIMIMVVLIYTIAKAYHLPALLFILIFGMFLNNLDEFKNATFIRYLQPKILNAEVHRFSRLVAEAAFLVRTIFFILFGYTVTTETLLNLETLPYALFIIAAILIVRFIQMKSSGQPIIPMLFIAPRGLITIMLFLSIPAKHRISLVNESLLLQVIIFSILMMMLGLLFFKKKAES